MGSRFAVLAVAVALASTASASAVSAAPTACKPGIWKNHGVKARVFCGPGTATVRVGPQTFRFRGGKCVRSSRLFTLHLGALSFGAFSHLRYFGMSIAAGGDGTYRAASVAWRHGGRNYVLMKEIRVTLAGRQSRGTFSGRIHSGQRVSGSFACSPS